MPVMKQNCRECEADIPTEGCDGTSAMTANSSSNNSS